MTFLAKVLLTLVLIPGATLAIPSTVIYVEPKLLVKESAMIPLVLLEIAKCESNSRQFDKDGNVIRGVVNPHDLGLFQINELYHGEMATKMGWDLLTEEGNTKMALYLYKNQGTVPWRWSRQCWQQKVDLLLAKEK